MAGISRRDFVAGTLAGVASVAVAVSVRGEYVAQDKASTSAFDAGAIADMKDGLNDKFNQSQKVLLVKKDGKIYAMTSVCLHQKGTLKNGGDGKIWCTKHAPGRFDDAGKPLAGPPTKQHADEYLTRYGVELKDGHLWVDKSKTFTKAEDFEKDGAFAKA